VQAPHGTKALAQGLAIVRILSEAAEPLSATAVAERLGVSVSTASRALGALNAAGYVIKPDYHHFAPSIGVVTLAANAREHFGIAEAARHHYSARARDTGWLWSVGTVHGSQTIYLLRAGPNHEAVELAVGRFPLHLSIIGLRTLLELEVADAVERLRHSRRLYGWECPDPQIPDNEEALLAMVRAAVDSDGILVLTNWRKNGDAIAGIALAPASDGPRVVGLVGDGSDAEAMRVALRDEINRR
jgi:DNA-binding IclR family transcriptional regulator